jgi:uncharacterized protein
VLTLSEIWIYPIKSLGGLSLPRAVVQERGLQYDRRWMIVDEHNRFVTQRSLHRMALLQVALEGTCLRVTDRANDTPPLRIPLLPLAGESLRVSIWDDEAVEAVAVGAEADHWLSRALDRSLRLVYMPNSSERRVDPDYAHRQEIVSFADAYPFLLIGQASLDDLNQRLANPVSMRRFRPNLVVTGAAPYAEDEWRQLRVGTQEFSGVKPCARCVLTTVDPDTAQTGPEPLKTMATYRQRNNKIYFGQNLLTQTTGEVAVGDRVEVL